MQSRVTSIPQAEDIEAEDIESDGSKYAHADAGTVSVQISKGIQSTSAGQIARLGLQFGTQLALTRLIAPREFGLVAMGAVLTGFAATLAESGTQAAIVQRKDLQEANLSAALMINLVVALIVSVVLAASAPLIAEFYGAPGVEVIVWIITPTFVISALAVVHRGLLERELRFRALAAIDVVAAVLGSATGIGLALAGFGAVAIVANGLAAAIVTSILSWASIGWFPRMAPTRSAITELVGFSGHFLNFNIVNYWARNLDNLLVGKFFGPYQAGLYTRAYGLLLLPLTQVSAVYGRVMFASMASVQDNLARVRDAYTHALSDVSSLTTPLLLGLALLAGDVVPLVLGEQWKPAVGMIRVFALVGIVQSLTTTIGWIFLSQGRPKQMSHLAVFNSACVIVSFFVGVVIGSPFAVAVSYAIAGVIVTYPTVRVGYGLIDLPIRLVARRLAPSFLAAMAMIPTTLVAHVALGDARPVLRVLAETLVGAATYAVVGHALRIPIVDQLLPGVRARPRRDMA